MSDQITPAEQIGQAALSGFAQQRTEIETLRRQLAEKDAEIERLKEEVRVTKEEDFPRKIKAVANNWRTKLAESRASEQQLRKILTALGEHHYNPFEPDNQCKWWHKIKSALDTSTDDTALRQMVEEAGEVMRRLAVTACATFGATLEVDTGDCYAEEVSAIPKVALEDLRQ